MVKSKGKKKAAANASSKNFLTSKLPLPDPGPQTKLHSILDRPKGRVPLAPASANTKVNQKIKPPTPLIMSVDRSLRYGSKESAKRLNRIGFDPIVTVLSPEEVCLQWSKTAKEESHKPVVDTANIGPAGPKKCHVTIAPLILGSTFCSNNRERVRAKVPALDMELPNGTVSNSQMNAGADQSIGQDAAEDTPAAGSSSDETRRSEVASAIARLTGLTLTASVSGSPPEKSLIGALKIEELNVSILQTIFESGFQNVLKLSMTSLESLHHVQSLIMTFSFTSSEFLTARVHSTMFIVVNPEITIGDFWVARDRDPFGMLDENFIASWCNEAMAEEQEGFRVLINHMLDPKETPLDFDAAAILKHAVLQDNNIFATRRAVCGQADEVFKPTVQREGMSLQHLLKRLSAQRQSIECLHFEKVPFIDRRLLAVILHGCEKATIVSLDSCPLIHAGDILPILDEIYVINQERLVKGLPVITSLDFGPFYEQGMPFEAPTAATYGLTWDPLRPDIAQTGLYVVLYKAFFKARAMGIKNLFDEDGALLRFLMKLPTSPLGIPTFLDACHRIADLAGLDSSNDMKKAMYDLFQVVSNTPLTHNRDWLHVRMMKDCCFCVVCGYKMSRTFFYRLNSNTPEGHCFGCQLQIALDQQTHHLRVKRIECLDILFPGLEPREINPEAPLDKPGEANPLMKLMSMEYENPNPSVARVFDDSHDAVSIPKKLGRQSCNYTGMVGVSKSGLDRMAAVGSPFWGPQWEEFHAKATAVDTFRRAVWLLHDQKDQGLVVENDAMGSTLKHYAIRGRPDHYLEAQAPVAMDVGLSMTPVPQFVPATHKVAKAKYLKLLYRGEIAGGSIEEILPVEELAEFAATLEDSYW